MFLLFGKMGACASINKKKKCQKEEIIQTSSLYQKEINKYCKKYNIFSMFMFTVRCEIVQLPDLCVQKCIIFMYCVYHSSAMFVPHPMGFSSFNSLVGTLLRREEASQ